MNFLSDGKSLYVLCKILEVIGSVVYDRRVEQGAIQGKDAKSCGIHIQTYRGIEKGTKNYGIMYLLLACLRVEVPLSRVFYDIAAKLEVLEKDADYKRRVEELQKQLRKKHGRS